MILPSVWRQQPQQATQVDWSHPLARKLVLAHGLGGGAYLWDAVSGKPSTLVGGARSGAGLPGSVTGFGTAGSGSVATTIMDAIATPLKGTATQRSYLIMLRRLSAGASSAGRAFTIGTAVELYQNSSTVLTLRRRAADATVTQYQATGASGSTDWRTVGMSHDESSITNLPRFYEGGVELPVALNGTASASAPLASTGALYLGNRSDVGLVWDGQVALMLVWDRILSPIEFAAISRNPWQMFRAPGHAFYAPLAGILSPSTGALATLLGTANAGASGAVLAGGAAAFDLGAVLPTSGGAVLATGAATLPAQALQGAAVASVLAGGTFGRTLDAAQASGIGAALAGAAASASLATASATAGAAVQIASSTLVPLGAAGIGAGGAALVASAAAFNTAAASASGAGAAFVGGALSATPFATQAGSAGAVLAGGAAIASFAPMAVGGAGAVLVGAATSAPLGAAGVTSSGIRLVPVLAAIVQTLGAATSLAAGAAPVSSSIAATMGAATNAGAGAVLARGDAITLLGPALLAGIVEQQFTPPPLLRSRYQVVTMRRTPQARTMRRRLR